MIFRIKNIVFKNIQISKNINKIIDYLNTKILKTLINSFN